MTFENFLAVYNIPAIIAFNIVLADYRDVYKFFRKVLAGYHEMYCCHDVLIADYYLKKFIKHTI